MKLVIDERAAGIATKLNGDMAQMRSEANTSRDALRGAALNSGAPVRQVINFARFC